MSKSDKNPRDPMPGTLRHWREALPEERMAHLIKDTARGFSRSLQARLREHAVQYGHWTFLRILWQTDGLTQRQLSEQAGVAEPTTFSALKTMESLGYLTRQKLPDNRKQVRMNVEAIYMNRSAIGYTAVPYQVGGTGWVFTFNVGSWF